MRAELHGVCGLRCADVHECTGEPLDFEFRVLYDEHEIVQLVCEGPPSTSSGWTFPAEIAFDLRTGELLTADRLFLQSADKELQARYRVAWKKHRPSTDPGCEKEGYAATLESFVFGANGMAFNDVASVPMHMRMCLGAEVLVPYAVAKTWMKPAFASRFTQ